MSTIIAMMAVSRKAAAILTWHFREVGCGLNAHLLSRVAAHNHEWFINAFKLIVGDDKAMPDLAGHGAAIHSERLLHLM